MLTLHGDIPRSGGTFLALHLFCSPPHNRFHSESPTYCSNMLIFLTAATCDRSPLIWPHHVTHILIQSFPQFQKSNTPNYRPPSPLPRILSVFVPHTHLQYSEITSTDSGTPLTTPFFLTSDPGEKRNKSQ